MRVYFLKLESSDFVTQDGNTWTTNTIDLYSNSSYVNYSTVKSSYGTNLLGNGTWTGLDKYSSTTTDSGYISSGRFVDTSARIDLISYSSDITSISGSGNISSQLFVLSSDKDNAVFPEEWVESSGYTPGSGIDIVDSYRYIKIKVVFNAPASAVYDPTIFIRVEIDAPIMAPLYSGTKGTINKFPSWMAIREDAALALPDQSLATPNSISGKFLNAAAGEWLDDLRNKLVYTDLQRFIDSVDLNQKAWVYKTHLSMDILYSCRGDGISPTHAWSLEEFFESTDAEDIILWDEENDVIYSNKLYSSFTLNGTVYSQEPHHVWNAIDELGLQVDLRRLHLESNANFKLRILDVYRNPLGVNVESFKLALRRELDIWRVYGSSPDSNYYGATPEVLEIEDLEDDPLYIDYEGLPTSKFIALADDNANRYPVTWGKFKWNRAIWDVGGDENKGFTNLPYRYDADPFIEELTQSGVGDGNDLLAFHPNVLTGPRDVTFKLRARGKVKTNRTEYPPVDLEFYIYGQGDRTVYDNPTTTVWLTVEITTQEVGSPIYYYSFQIANKSNVDVDRVTSTSRSTETFMDDDGTGTDKALAFAKKTDGSAYAGTGIIPNSDIDTVKLRSGKWNVGTQTYILGESSDTFAAYFSNNESGILLYNTSTGSVPSYSQSGGVLPRPRVVMYSKVISSSTQTWNSVKTPYKVTINNAPIPTAPSSVSIAIPTILFDPYVSDPSKKYVVELKTVDSNGVHGAYFRKPEGTQDFITYQNIAVNGSASWTSNYYKTFSKATTTTLQFSTTSAVNYPITNSIYEMFEAQQVDNFFGILDENGPYKNGVPPKLGNTNFSLTTLNPTRADFNIPNNDNYIVNWIGVDVIDDNKTIAWLDSNSVNPAFPIDNLSYPDNAIVETYDSGVYSFGPFVVRARLKTDPDIRWYPQIHSGYFYQNQQEYYLFAEPHTEHLSSTPTTFALETGAYQGAPIIVRSPDGATPHVTFRQIAPTWYMEPNFATPSTLGIHYEEEVQGTGIDILYAAYDDIYDIEVTNLSRGIVEDLYEDWSTTNQISLQDITKKDWAYKLRYKVNHSFVADNENVINGQPRTRLIFDKSPVASGLPYYKVTYEGSRFDPATPIATALNPQYTSLDEAFLFISYDEYDMSKIEIYLSPSSVIADGSDYIIATIRTLDVYGNPKANQTINLTTSFGSIYPSKITTDNDGVAFTTITSAVSQTIPSGTITATSEDSEFTASEDYIVSPYEVRDGRLLASVSSDEIPSDGSSKVEIVGRVENGSFTPTPNAVVRWRKSRSLYEILNYAATPYYNGSVVANTNGIFHVGPFTSATPDSGYWFVSMESNSASPSGNFAAVGDVVYWYEYPKSNYGAENFSGLPHPPIQHATPLWNFNYGGPIPPYTPINQFPSNYDEATPTAHATPNHSGGHVIWLPPRWFALPRYIQYQMGLLGDIIHRDVVDLSTVLQKALKDRKWI